MNRISNIHAFSNNLPVAIIGGGPAGLSAASALIANGHRCKIFDAGHLIEDRSHTNADDLGVGIGGAGLFSDGKFSFYPSGTKLYDLSNKRQLATAYSWCENLLAGLGIGAEPFPELSKSAQPFFNGVKCYPSHYASLQQRRDLIVNLGAPLGQEIASNSNVTQIKRTDAGYRVRYEGQNGSDNAELFKSVVLATGRFASIDIETNEGDFDIPMTGQRFEMGLRIEGAGQLSFLKDLKQPDVKRIMKYDEAEIRTFCTCRNGEIWRIPVGNLAALSGRSDGPPTEFSNFGFLARFEGKNLELGQEIWKEILPFIQNNQNAIYEPVTSFLSDNSAAHHSDIDPVNRPWYPKENFEKGSIREIIGPDLYRILSTALRDLVSWAPDLADPESVCIFPTVEGVGSYPETDGSLKVIDQDIWCCGDAVGKFRGLIPCMVSGYYAGLEVSKSMLDAEIKSSLVSEDA